MIEPGRIPPRGDCLWKDEVVSEQGGGIADLEAPRNRRVLIPLAALAGVIERPL